MNDKSYEEIPLKHDIDCSDGACGRIRGVVIDPATRHLTHVLVHVEGEPDERVVPAQVIAQADAQGVRLSLSKAEAATEPKFETTIKVQSEQDALNTSLMGTPFANITMPGLSGTVSTIWPISFPLGKRTDTYKQENIPAGELSIQAGTRVEAADGDVGRVEAFLVDTESCQISHLVLRPNGHPIEEAKAVPYEAVKATGKNTIYLALSKAEVNALPTLASLRG